MGVTAAGSFMARRAGSSAGWAVAGGGMSTSLIAIGIAGNRIGGAGTYGVAGNVISGGVWNLWWYGINTFLALAIVGLFFGVFFRRLKLHTVGELFTIRFGNRRCQWLTSLCVQTEYAVVGGVALAAVLAAVISSGGPILLSSATMFVRDWLPFTGNYTSDQQLKAYRITTTIYAFLAAIAAWFVATYTTISILDLLLFGFAMVVPPALSVAYLVYWQRTTEQGAYWGMVAGYVSGLIWFALIKIALSAGFAAPEGAGLLRRLLVYGLTVGGEGIDPSYLTFFIPLFVVPIVSLMTSQGKVRDDFSEMLSGRTPVEEKQIAGAG